MSVFLSVGAILFGLDVRLEKKITLSQEKVFIQNVYAFCVTEHDFFILPDYKAGHIKIYDPNGKVANIVGRKGHGPGELIKPNYCDYQQPDFAVMDYGRRKMFIYRINKNAGAKPIKDFFCVGLGFDLYIDKNLIYVCGNVTDGSDGRQYDLYTYNTDNGQIRHLIPAEMKYGYATFSSYKSGFLANNAPIGMKAYCTLHGNDAYFVWEGDLRVVRIDVKTRKMNVFGHKSSGYHKPKVTKELREAYKERDRRGIKEERDKLSYVVEIFSGADYIGLIYQTFETGSKKYMVQFYRPDGRYIKETMPNEDLSPLFYFRKDIGTLYNLAERVGEDEESVYEVLKYRVLK